MNARIQMQSFVRLAAALLLIWGVAHPAAAQHVGANEVPVNLQNRWIDLSAEDWQRGKNGRQANFDFTIGRDSTLRNAGFFGQRLRRSLLELGAVPPETEAALNRYRRQKWLFLGERIVFGTTMIAAGADILINQYAFGTSEIILTSVAVTSLITNIWVSRNTNSHLQRAVMEYQGALFPQKPTGWRPNLRPAFGGLTPQRGGGVGVAIGWNL
jgi:hypothetical protein